MDDDIENAYREALNMEIGKIITNNPINTIYKDEQAFALQVHCVHQDYPPPGNVTNDKFYKIVIESLNHSTLMLILTSLRDILTLEYCTKNMHALSYGIKRNGLHKELQALSISYMGKWISCSKNNTYSLSIRYIPYKLCTKICRVLFSW